MTNNGNETEFCGLLQRDATGFVLNCDDGQCYRLEMLRTPIDEVEKRVVVTGRLTGDTTLEADGIRLT